jgi:uncharacterized iron-regulated protein
MQSRAAQPPWYDYDLMWRVYYRRLPFLACAAWVFPVYAQDARPLQAVVLEPALSIDSLAAQIANKRVIFVGETHERYDHHLNQLAIIRRLHQLNPNLSLGVEYFQQPFQPQVDDYIAGRSTEKEFLHATQYYRTWGFDYRLYAPIFRFAREQGIPVRALNIPSGLASAAAKVGIAGLSGQQRASLPREIGTADEEYRSRLRKVFEMHKAAKPEAFEHFVEAQLLWDEGMAENAAAYLMGNPERQMVILAGSGHVAFGAGIPKRLERRIHASYTILLSPTEEIEPRAADFLFLGGSEELPAAGVLGIALEEKNEECRIRSLEPGGAAVKSGLKKGDVLAAIDGRTVKTTADLHLALWDKNPGDRVLVSVRRKSSGTRDIEVELAAPGKASDQGP